MITKCKICREASVLIFSKKILLKYDVDYYRCEHCNFLQTEEPYWIVEAYSSGAISALDTGILYRNLMLKEKTRDILFKLFKNFSHFIALDYGGGEGIFVRMMRDIGFNFYRYDIYADNLYARFFDIMDLPSETKFDILTAFEVFEHFPDPIPEIEKMFRYSDVLLFSTELQPKIDELENWWYIGEEAGQHISFYTEKSFQEVAKKTNSYYCSNKKNLHIISKNKLSIDPFEKDINGRVKESVLKKLLLIVSSLTHPPRKENKRNFPESLTMSDFYYVKTKIKLPGN